jgi:hypothetical protein
VFKRLGIDTLPKEVQAGLMFGGPFAEAVPGDLFSGKGSAMSELADLEQAS